MIPKLIKTSKKDISLIQWYRERHWNNLANIRILTKQLKLTEDKLIYTEDIIYTRLNMVLSYSNLAIRIRELKGTRKVRRGRKSRLERELNKQTEDMVKAIQEDITMTKTKTEKIELDFAGVQLEDEDKKEGE
jgi:hypothetical protein